MPQNTRQSNVISHASLCASSEHRFSENPRIDRLLRNVVNELRAFTEEQAQQITDLVDIGKVMSAEHDPANILELILSHARKVTRAIATASVASHSHFVAHGPGSTPGSAYCHPFPGI